MTEGEGRQDEPSSGAGTNRRGRLHGQATEQLRALIISGDLPPGTRLREVALCERFGVSRTPLREAIRTLAAEGMVQRLPNRSAIVTGLDAGEIAHLYQVVAALEALAGELACQRITEIQIAEIAGMQSEMVGQYEKRDRIAYLALNHRIHRRVVEIAGNAILLESWQALLPRVARARALPNLDEARWIAAIHEHAQMFAALAARNGALLGELTRQHFMNGLALIPGAPPQPA